MHGSKIFCKQIQRDCKGFYFCVDKDISFKFGDVFFINPGCCAIELLNTFLHSGGDWIFQEEKF